MEITIRPYDPRDRPAFLACMDKLQRHLADVDPYQLHSTDFESRVRYTDWLFDRIIAGDGLVLVALDGEQVIGCAAGFLEPLSEEDRIDLAPLAPARVQPRRVGCAHHCERIKSP